jgi:hypothetical protein
MLIKSYGGGVEHKVEAFEVFLRSDFGLTSAIE